VGDELLYETFIPLAFHVDYWDYIGHVDTLAKAEFTKRQKKYAAEWGSRNIYTPEFVKDCGGVVFWVTNEKSMLPLAVAATCE